MIKSLQSLRFVFALLIFHHHFFLTPQVDQFGLYPVCFFFILSGFVMAMGWGDRVLAENFNYRTYLIKRLIRLLPLNLLCLVLSLIMPIISDLLNNQVSLSKYIFLPIDVLLLQAFFPIKSIYFSGNAVAWFLSDMLFCYLLFPFIFRWIKKRNGIMKIAIIPVVYLVLISFIKEDLVHSLLYISPFFRIVDFILGIIVYELVSKVKITNTPSILLTTIEMFAIGISVLVFFVYPIVPVAYTKAALFWLPSVTIILVFYYSEQSGGGVFCKIAKL